MDKDEINPKSTPRSWFGWSRPNRILLIAAAFLAAFLSYRNAADSLGPPRPLPRFLIDPNTAPVKALTALPRVGPVTARNIVQARETRPFDSLDDFDRRVTGIGPVARKSVEPHLTFGHTPKDAGTEPTKASK